jgi:hypothetical protein
MKTNNFFDLKRALLLLKRIMFINKKSIILGLSIYLGIAVLYTLLFIYQAYFNNFTIIYSSFIFMFIWGLIFTIHINKEIYKPASASLFLTLPASHFERLLLTWLVSSVLYTAVFTLIIYFVVYLSAFLTTLTSNAPEYIPVFSDILKISLYYFVIQTVYFFGSIFFKKGHFIKTSLAIIILITAVVLLMVLVYNLVIGNIWSGGIGYLPGTSEVHPDIFKFGFINIITFYVTPLLLLTATYFRIKEKQI